MDRQTTARVMLTGTGIASGLGLYGLSHLADAGVLTGRPLLALAGFSATFFTALLAMSGPLSVKRAALGAAIIATVVMALLTLAAFGFVAVEDAMDSPHVVLGAVVLSLLPLPFWIARHGVGWQSYPALFGEAWAIVVRGVAAWAFVGLVWATILLSDALLKGVRIDLIDRLIDLGPTPWVVTGGALGLGLAVVQELSDYVSPYLILRLLRLLLPVVLAVSALFLLMLPLRGVSGLFGAWSFALTLLAMSGAAATLVTTAVDQDDAQATQSPLLRRAAQAMSLLLPLLAGLGAWAVWVRVAQYGWTPDRVFAAQVAVLAIGYGAFYAVAMLRGAGWMARVRKANVAMALAVMGMAALSMTPILSAERLSTHSLMTRLEDGRLPVADLDVGLLSRWGKPGADAREALVLRAAQPGEEDLARRLALSAQPVEGQDRGALLASVVAILPVQPAGATATRDMYLETMDSYRLSALHDSCGRQMPGGGAGCVMVVADLEPWLPGEEAILLDYGLGGFVQFTGFRNDPLQGPVMRDVLPADGGLPQYEAGEALIRAWQAAPPPLVPLVLNQLRLPEGGGLILAP